MGKGHIAPGGRHAYSRRKASGIKVDTPQKMRGLATPLNS